jgi:hypothetical protein
LTEPALKAMVCVTVIAAIWAPVKASACVHAERGQAGGGQRRYLGAGEGGDLVGGEDDQLAGFQARHLRVGQAGDLRRWTGSRSALPSANPTDWCSTRRSASVLKP